MNDEGPRRWLKRLGRAGRWLDRHLVEVDHLLGEGLHIQGDVSRGSRAILGGVFVVRTVTGAELTVRASSITYTFLFSLVPLLATTLFLLAAVPGLQDERANLESALFEYFLPGAAQAVQGYLAQFTEQAAAAGAVSSLIFFVITMLLLRSVEDSFNVIWQVRRPRTWRQRTEVLALSFFVGALALTALGAVAGLARSLQAQVEIIGAATVGSSLTQWGLGLTELVVSWLVFGVATKALPNTAVGWRSAAVAGLISGTVWHFLKDAFTWYVSTFPSYENLYGALGTIPVFLLWIYLSFLLLFVCASLAYVHQNLPSLIQSERMQTGTHFPVAYFAVAVVALLVERFNDRQTGANLAVPELARRLEVEPLLVVRVLEPLVAGNLVVEMIEDGEPRYMLGVAAERISVRDVVLASIGDELVVPEHKVRIQEELRARIVDIFGAARVGRDSALDTVTLDTLGEAVVYPPGFLSGDGGGAEHASD